MGQKILSGSLIQNPTNIQVGSTTEQVIDRGSQLFSSAKIAWQFNTIYFYSPLQIQFQLSNGQYAYNQISNAVDSIQSIAGQISLATNEAIIVRLNRVSGTTTLGAVASYASLTAGSYCRTNISSLSNIDLNHKDDIVLFMNVFAATPNAANYLSIPFTKETLAPGQELYPGEPVADIYQADYCDPFSISLPTSSAYIIDGTLIASGFRVLFTNLGAGKNIVYQATVSGPSVTWQAMPLFYDGSTTPSNGDIIKILNGTIYGRQQAIYDGVNLYWNFNDIVRYVNQSGNYIEETALRDVSLAANATTQIFSINANGNENIVIEFSMKRNNFKETGQIFVTNNGLTASAATSSAYVGALGVTFSAIISGANVQLLATLDNSGSAALLKFTAKRWSDSPGGAAGLPNYSVITQSTGVINSAFTMSDGSDVPNNCSSPYLVLGKTRIDLLWTYVLNINPGTTAGDLEVIVDGLVLPRYLAGATTTGAYYSEIDSNTIEFYTDLSGIPLSIEVRRRYGTFDISSTNSARLSALNETVVGSATDVSQGVATWTSLQAAISWAATYAPNGKILVLQGYSSVENIVIPNTVSLFIEGKGHGTVINGSLNVISNYSVIKFLKVAGNIQFNGNSNIMTDCWQPNVNTVLDGGTDNLYTLVNG